MTPLDHLSMSLPRPHYVGWPFVALGILLSLLGLKLGQWLIWAGVGLAGFCWFFFRNPPRVTIPRDDLVVAPADGLVSEIRQASPPPELELGDRACWRVSIFLSVLDVHANRVPCCGKVTRIEYRHGSFMNAGLDKASVENERNSVTIRVADGRHVVFVQIAGLIARRILCFLREGQEVSIGDIGGFIRFGSRTDIYLPHGVTPQVVVGQIVTGGETIVASLSVDAARV